MTLVGIKETSQIETSTYALSFVGVFTTVLCFGDIVIHWDVQCTVYV